MESPTPAAAAGTTQPSPSNIFTPTDLTTSAPTFSLPPKNNNTQEKETWTSMLSTPVSFEPEYFSRVMQNLIAHPEIASTYLFRAEILYDSFTDPEGKFLRFVRGEFRPRVGGVGRVDGVGGDRVRGDEGGVNGVEEALERDGWVKEKIVVRRMVPRNPARDEALVQTCGVYRRVVEGDGVRGGEEGEGAKEENLVLYWPHVGSAEEVPFYHPAVQALAFLHSWTPSPTSSSSSSSSSSAAQGTLSIHASLFTPRKDITPRLQRTALSLLSLINKHALGQKAGYKKRVHHDQLVPQARFQDTYTRLKASYAKALIQGWVEQTPPGKHVFEDLGIAAFLIELWGEMYDLGEGKGEQGEGENGNKRGKGEGEGKEKKTPFPGFVDIGCGNGVLVYVLLKEGFRGWGFDARRRKTWDTFPENVRACLKEMVLVPEVLTRSLSSSTSLTSLLDTPTSGTATASASGSASVSAAEPMQSSMPEDSMPEGSETESSTPEGSKTEDSTPPTQNDFFHPGVFPTGTFIISNHADELTPWTPLLASLSQSPFLAIPCCSHNLAGAKFRAPVQKGASTSSTTPTTPPSTNNQTPKEAHEETNEDTNKGKGHKSGSLAPKQGKQPSAYATLCDWVSRLAVDVGYAPEKEMLRIPSTRNAGIVGRVGGGEGEAGEGEAGEDVRGVAGLSEKEDERKERVRRLLVKEMGGSGTGGTSGVEEGDNGALEHVAREWVLRAGKLVRGQGGGH